MSSKKPAPQDNDDTSANTPAPYHTGKGRPTRSRAEAEAARKRPLVPTDRRAAAKAARAAQRDQRELEYEAMKTGDESKMPYRDRGPVKRYIRNFVDARRNMGEYFLFIALLFLVVTLFSQVLPAEIVLAGLIGMYVVVILAIADGFILWRQLKKRLVAKFGQDALMQRGLAMYAVMRAFQIRRARLPKPMVKHGNYPS
ncbi:DUF3043 domain-containing protein [Jonesia quinghaiensis]|uniref:DUF3043 domain-containing protein n=1 Tax=Jonesia quinghaiensis TaxID=262806 RepID=UPI000490BC51|nr:DUF3043 domain-containing protein [Jonesia quinghaiensis]